MSARLPQTVDPWRLAGQGGSLAGEVAITELQRVAEALLESDGKVTFEFRFERDTHGRILIDGFVRAELRLRCQRCLEGMTLPVDAEVSLAVIEAAAEADRIPEEREPVLAEEGGLRINDLLEDELLLAIPQVPMHAQTECAVDLSSFNDPVASEARDQDAGEGDNPFAVLSALRTDKEN